MCYARPDQISPIVLSQLQQRGVGLQVGRAFWEFISGDANCLAEILDIASSAADESAPGERSFSERVEMKLEQLTREFHSRYGHTLTADTWRRFLTDNS